MSKEIKNVEKLTALQEEHNLAKYKKLYNRGNATSEQIKVLLEVAKEKRQSGIEMDTVEKEILKIDSRRKFLIASAGILTVSSTIGATIRFLLKNTNFCQSEEKEPKIELPEIRTISKKEKIQLSPEQLEKKNKLILCLQRFIEKWKTVQSKENNQAYDMIIKDFFYEEFPSLREQILKLYQYETSLDFYFHFSKLKDCLLEYGLHIEIGAMGDDIIIEISEIEEIEMREISYNGKTSKINILYINELKNCRDNLGMRIIGGWHQTFSNNILVNKNANQKGPIARLLKIEKPNNELEAYYVKLMQEKLKNQGFDLENIQDLKLILDFDQESTLNHESMHTFLEEHYFIPIMRKTGRIYNKINLQKPQHQVELTLSDELKNFSIETIEIDEALAYSYQFATEKKTNLLNYIALLLTDSFPTYNYSKQVLNAELVKTPLCQNNTINDVIKTMITYDEINNLIEEMGENVFKECFQDLEDYYKAVMSK